VLVNVRETFKSLGVEYPINPGDSTSSAVINLKLIPPFGRSLSRRRRRARSTHLSPHVSI